MRQYRRVLAHFPAHRRRIALGIACIPLASALDLVTPWLVGGALDRLREATGAEDGAATPGLLDGLFPGGAPAPATILAWTFFGLAGITALKGVFRYAMRRLLMTVSRHVEESFRNELFAKILRLPRAARLHHRTGDLLSRATADIESVRLFLGPGVMYLIGTATIVPIALGVLFWRDAALAAALLLPFAGMSIVIRILSPRLQKLSREVQRRLADLSNHAHENFSGVRVVKAYGQGNAEVEAMRRLGERFRAGNLRFTRARSLTDQLLHMVREVGFVLILALGGWHMIQPSLGLTLGEFYVFVDYLQKLYWPMIALGWMVAMYTNATAAMGRIEEVFAVPDDAPPPVDPAPDAPVRGAVSVRDLTYTFPGERRAALAGISFDVRSGGTLAIVGRTGSGKTTLASLLTRLLPAPEGCLRIDGTPLERLPLPRLRSSVILVPQDPFLFSDTIRANLAFGRPDASPEALWRAARQAQFADEVTAFPGGLDQRLGERGITLSGGQRQRCTLARALLLDPPVLLLDDCLSSVDAATERTMLETLREVRRDKTTIMISHRLAAVHDADEILVLRGGRIVERGRHDALLAAGGEYARLFHRQQVEEEVERL